MGNTVALLSAITALVTGLTAFVWAIRGQRQIAELRARLARLDAHPPPAKLFKREDEDA